MSKARIPSAFDTTVTKTERSGVAVLMHWMRNIIEEKKLDLGFPDVDTSGADYKSPDIVIYDGRQSQKALCVIEAKPPYHDVFDYENLKKPAWEKASKRKAKYFCTTNFKHLIWYNTERTNAQESEERQIHEKYNLSEIENLDLLEDARYKSSILNGIERFLFDLYLVHTNKKPEPLLPIDVFLIFRLQEKIKTLARHYRGIIRDKAHKEPTFMKSLGKWFVEQNWSFVGQESDYDKAARQAAYLLVNKILFYDLLQAKRPHELDPLAIPDDLTKGGMLQRQLQSYFDYVLNNIDYETIYSTDFIDQTAFPDNKEVVREIKDLITLLRRYDFSKLGFDIIGGIFERLIPAEERHILGQYFTNPDVVDIILRFCLKHENDKVFDPACGAGTFLVRAYQHKKHMNLRLGHEKILKTLWGTDIAKFPAHLSTINLAINDLAVDENYPQIFKEDFFALRLGGREEFGKEARKKTLVTIGGKKVTIDYPKTVDAIVGNPPYTRQEEISEISDDETYKEKVIRHALYDGNKKLAEISKRAGIYAYFFVHGTKFLQNGGRFGFVVSNSWLDVDYGKGLQEFFLKNYKIVAIIESKVERWFEDADINTCIVLLEKCSDVQQRNDNLVRFVYLLKPLRHFIPAAQDIWEKQVSRFDEIDKLMKTILSHNEFYQNDELRIYPKKQSELWEEGLETSPQFPLSTGGEGDAGGEVFHPKVPGYIYELCRKLRKNQTQAEALLWDCLRARRLNNLKFRRQHPLGRYIADFYCAEKKLVVELEGKVHELKDQKEYDKARQEAIKSLGLTVLRFKNEEVLNNLETVLAKITSPPILLSNFGEGERGGEAYIGSKWGKYLRAPQIFFTILEKGKDKLVPLKEVAKVRFGIKTGANEFFYLTEEEIKRRGIEAKFLQPIIFSLKEVSGYKLNKRDLENRVIICHKEKNELKGTRLFKYITEGEKKGFNKRPTCASRSPHPWYSLGIGWEYAPLIFPAKVGERMPVFINDNVFEDKKLYGVTPSHKEHIKLLAAILNSTISRLFIEFSCRQLTGAQAIADIDVVVVEKLPIVDVTKISGQVQKALESSFEKLCETPAESIFVEIGYEPTSLDLKKIKPERRNLDRIVMGEILGLTDEEQLEVYRAVVDLVKSRLEKAKSVNKKNKTKEGIDVDAFVKVVMEKIGGETLGKFYRERVITSPPFSPSPKLERGTGGEVKISQELFDWYLYIGKRHIKCSSELEARYLKVWVDAGVEKVKIPKDENVLKKIVPELERLKSKLDNIVNEYLNSIIDKKTRTKISHFVWQELVK